MDGFTLFHIMHEVKKRRGGVELVLVLHFADALQYGDEDVLEAVILSCINFF